MNIKKEIVRWHKRYKVIPEPFYVVWCDGHYMVCKCDKLGNLIDEVSNIHWDVWTVRRWAFEFAEKKVL